MAKTKAVFIFNLDEKDAAEILGVTVQCLKNWRSKGTISDYLYRRFGSVTQERVRYCQILLLRWQAKDAAERLEEEIWARSEIEKSLQVH